MTAVAAAEPVLSSALPSWNGKSNPAALFTDDYQLDDGTQENAIGLTQGGGVVWLNRFNVQSGLQNITAVSLAWGQVANGTAAQVLVYRDPNNDGNPTDAVLLTQAPTVVQNSDTDIFTKVNIPSTNVGAVGNAFFVGAVIMHAGGQFPAAIDQDSGSMGRSWIAGAAGAAANIMNLGANPLPPGVIDSFGLAGNWLVRANAVPEPATLSLLAVGALALIRRRSR
jgi:hypothetical protein